MYNLVPIKQKFKNIEEWLGHEYLSVRTGRATPAVLDPVNVDFYGVQNKISHIAAISVEDAKTLRIAPWDKGVVKLIESSLQTANLGVSVVVDGTGLRVIFPELTTERRKVLEKLLKEKQEEARISVKREREEALNDFSKEEKDGKISEDEKFKLKEELQKFVDECNANLENITERKIREIAG